jgi:hypothetical protein
MARRSLGVVLIVTLLGWTVSVNQPLHACTGSHSRAVAVALAGTPPALKPEPSPSRHSCCPSESHKLPAIQTPHHQCQASSLQFSSGHSCCSLTQGLPSPRHTRTARTPQSQALLSLPPQNGAIIKLAEPQSVSFSNLSPPPPLTSSHLVLRN